MSITKRIRRNVDWFVCLKQLKLYCAKSNAAMTPHIVWLISLDDSVIFFSPSNLLSAWKFSQFSVKIYLPLLFLSMIIALFPHNCVFLIQLKRKPKNISSRNFVLICDYFSFTSNASIKLIVSFVNISVINCFRALIA